MSLIQLTIQNVRNLCQVDLKPCSGINLVIGDNASGKTSLLESIYLLSAGKSFRTGKIQSIIQSDSEFLRITGKTINNRDVVQNLGIQRNLDGSFQIRIQGEAIKQASRLASILPVQIINPDVHKLLEQGPKQRRQFLDWGVFHVEHQFVALWTDYQRVLKQRNALLRKKAARSETIYWTEQLVLLADEVHQLRKKYLEALIPYLSEYTEILLGLQPQFQYSRGWAKDAGLGEVLERNFVRDQQLGYTQAGPHRSDLLIQEQGNLVYHTYSRGQQKLLVSAMRLAQIAYLKDISDTIPVLLIDDLAAELDPAKRNILLELFVSAGAQIFVTATEPGLLDLNKWKNTKMFHVEHGTVSEVV